VVTLLTITFGGVEWVVWSIGLVTKTLGVWCTRDPLQQ